MNDDKPIDAALPTLNGPYQSRVMAWMRACFKPAHIIDTRTRGHRFLEEALELVQAGGCTKDEAIRLVEYVYNRPVGVIAQEVGGTMVTLAALCSAFHTDLFWCADTELERCWTNIAKIRAKQDLKPDFGPEPGPTHSDACARVRFGEGECDCGAIP